jgi:hypothetical protein
VLGWWIDHRYQVAAANNNAKAAEQWQQIAEMTELRHESMMRSLGVKIEREGDTTSYELPANLPLPNSSAPAPNPPKP